MYTKKHEGKKLITWRCGKRSLKCLGVLKTDLDLTNPTQEAAHCHAADDDVIALKETFNDMKRKAQTSLDKPNQVRQFTNLQR
jgi:hypothetical protein